MSQQQKAILQKLLAILYKSGLWLLDVALLIVLAMLSWTTRSSTWLYDKLNPLKLKVKELYNDTRTTTKA